MVIINEDELSLQDDLTYEWQDKPFTGRTQRYRNGIRGSEVEYVNGMREGVSRHYYPSGKLRAEEHFMKNMHHGPALEWHENGRVKRDALYEYSVPVRDKTWDESGTLIKEYQLSEKDPLFETLQGFRRIYEN